MLKNNHDELTEENFFFSSSKVTNSKQNINSLAKCVKSDLTRSPHIDIAMQAVFLPTVLAWHSVSVGPIELCESERNTELT